MTRQERLKEAMNAAKSAAKIVEDNIEYVLMQEKKTEPAWMCPKCGSENISVVDSRRRPDYIFRARICLNCGNKYQTMEIVMENEK